MSGIPTPEQVIADALLPTGSSSWQRQHGYTKPGTCLAPEGAARMQAEVAVKALREAGYGLHRGSVWEAAIDTRLEEPSVTFQFVAEDCTCVFSCADDPVTACSLSGQFHTHPSTSPGDGFGACPVHPEAPGDV